jgi:hypothetical protein
VSLETELHLAGYYNLALILVHCRTIQVRNYASRFGEGGFSDELLKLRLYFHAQCHATDYRNLVSQKVSLFVPTGIADVFVRRLRVVQVEADGDVRGPSDR